MTRQYVNRSNESPQKDADNWILQRTAVRSLPAKTLTPQAQSPVGDRSGNQLDLMQIPVHNQDPLVVQPKLMAGSAGNPNWVCQLKEHQQNVADVGDTPVQQVAEVEAPNNTGLPNRLKAGVEKLSGMSMDDVRVHYNSSKPAQLNALAYTQGSDIHVGPGQEQHLPHEAWHVVQQKQGRVQPTMQLQKIGVNNDLALEQEADIRGKQASLLNLSKEPKKSSDFASAKSSIQQGKQPIVQTKGKGKQKSSTRKGNVGTQEREMARQIAADLKEGRRVTVFQNNENLLPRTKKNQEYYEQQPPQPGDRAVGMGERRVVVLANTETSQVLKKYATYTHYGTGQSSKKGKADFVEF